MVSVDIVNAALADLVVQGNLATAKIEELANDIESKLLAAIAVNAQQITTVVAGIQAEIDKVALLQLFHLLLNPSLLQKSHRVNYKNRCTGCLGRFDSFRTK